MDKNHQTSVLYPLWHSTTISKHSCFSCHVDAKLLPDYGGAGVDVHMASQLCTIKNPKNISAHFLKSEVPTQNFSSKKCVLPFSSPNSLDSLLDPCSEHLRQLQNKQKQYCTSMFHIFHSCRKDNKKRYLKLKTELSTKHKDQDEIIVPKRLVEISNSKPDIFPVPLANWLYSGGCLTSVACNGINDGIPLLIHPGGTHLNDVVITSAVNKEFSNEKPVASVKWKFNLKGSPIHQISVKMFDEAIMGCIRQEQNYHIISGKIEDMSDENVFETMEKISYCSVSPYIKGEYVVLTESGHLILKNADKECATWNSLQEIKNFHRKGTWHGCDFGSHPRCITYGNCKELSLVDLRAKRNKCLQIFDTSSPFLFPKEELMLSKLNVAQPYQHFIGTNHHMILCDERYSQQPLSVWNHLLDSYPMYCDILHSSDIDNSSRIRVLLGTHFPQQVAYFSLMSSSYSQVQPLSCMPPCHLSVPTDIAEYLKLQCITLEESIIKRLSAPIIGACTAVNKQGFLFFQLTSLGDIFYQNYSKNGRADEKIHSVGPGCSFSPPFEMSDVDWWLKEAKLTTNSSSTSISEPLMQIDCSKEFDSMHMLPTPPETDCSFCCKSISGNISVKSCPSCGIQSNDGKNIFNATKLNTVIPKVASEALDTYNYSVLIKKEISYDDMDPLSQSIYDTWFGEDTSTELAEQNGSCATITENKTNESLSAKISTNFNYNTGTSEKSFTEEFDDMEDEIGPSQEISQLLGETIRSSAIKKKRKCLPTSDGF